MAKTPVSLAPAARQDIRDLLRWSEQAFGKDAALRYEALLVQALRDIEEDAHRPGVIARPELLINGLFSYHLSQSRHRVAGERVGKPRHFLIYCRVRGRIEIVRVLSESSDLPRHLPD